MQETRRCYRQTDKQALVVHLCMQPTGMETVSITVTAQQVHRLLPDDKTWSYVAFVLQMLRYETFCIILRHSQ
jgi:hypothetical protein